MTGEWETIIPDVLILKKEGLAKEKKTSNTKNALQKIKKQQQEEHLLKITNGNLNNIQKQLEKHKNTFREIIIQK